jgi:hypothetical protein
MKITRRSDAGTGGHLLVSVPGGRIAEIDGALRFLEAQCQQRGSQIIIDVIVRAAKRRGWLRDAPVDLEPDG